MEKTKKRRLVIWMLVALIVATTGLIFAQAAKTDYGKTEVTQVNTISPSGFKQSMEVYVPQGVSAENPAPAIVIQHGGNNNKEEMELYAIELSRRGYVAITNDMYNMGDSEVLPDSLWLTAGRGLYDAVKFARTLPYVDADNISLLGYSRGGIASSECIKLDGENNYIKNIFIIHADSYYMNEEGFHNWYGNRNVALIADQYDEFFFVFKNFEGSYSNDANKYADVNASSVDYINRDRAQSFLHFGEDPTGLDKRSSDTVYTQVIDGKETIRAIFVTNSTHMVPWFSGYYVEKAVSFFQRVMPTSTSLASNTFVYSVDNFFSLVGILSLIVFMASLAMLLMESKLISASELTEPKIRETSDKKGLAWFWILLVVITILSVLVILFLNSEKLSAYHDGLFHSANPIYRGLIGIMCGTFSLLACLVWYLAYGKKQKFDLKSTGLYINGQQLWKTILVALISIAAMYAVVFTAYYLSGVKLFFIYWQITPFTANRIPGMLAVLPLYIVFYVAMSISFNCFNFTRALTRVKWLNNILVSLIAVVPTLFVILYSYGRYYATGQNPMFGGLASAAVAVLPLPAFIFVAILLSRIIYTKTGNPYLGGIISGIFAAITEWSVCEIRIPEAGGVLPSNPLVYIIIAGCLLVFAGILMYFYKARPKME